MSRVPLFLLNTTTHLLFLMFWFAVWGFIAMQDNTGRTPLVALAVGVLWALWVWRESVRREELVKLVQEELTTRFTGRATTSASFSSIVSYGAVDISPEHCVFWIILVVEPAHLPAYSTLDKLHAVEDETLRTWLKELADEALSIFHANGWRHHWPLPKLGFESSHRVSWFHFK